jgi:hypothetical protein
MISIPIPTATIPPDPANLSPALASLAGQLMMPGAWARVMQDAVLSTNEKCAVQVNNIDK